MNDILNHASTAIREAQLRATSGADQDTLGVALDLIEGELPNLLDLLHDLTAAYSKLCPDPRKDVFVARAHQLIERLEGMTLGSILAAEFAVDEIEE